MVRHSREDVVSERQFEELMDAAGRLDEPFKTECRFVLIATGRLGLRAGELCHVREDWIDWDRELLKIPRHDRCTKADGDRCGYCRTRAESATEHNEDKTFKEALAERWEPKTENGARAVPFGYSERVKNVMQEFFFFYDEYPASRASVNRRVDRVLDEAGVPRSTCYPHSLRATAGTFHAYRGLSTAALQALMGWAKLGTASKYVRVSGGQTTRALEKVHGD